ncbi:LCP family protein [Streptomyces sp. NBC_00237]|uniref:LCP family protein n=1 Tax=Streptomyces sp. NBC_00237 TaxID=2975687 RepID=UPI00225AC3CC|nr:LCP family protein [Streptomyces sp. NBC_00237]MCX5205211.1 LCP family protein [Streptomyces sp. NBC_00237]
MGNRGKNTRAAAGGGRRKQSAGRSTQPSGYQDRYDEEPAEPYQGRAAARRAQAGGGRGRAANRRGRRRPPGRFRTLKWVLAALVVLGGSGLAWVYFSLDGNLRQVDIEAELGTNRPSDVDDGSMDILVLGSDSRSGSNGAYGKDVGSARADITMVVHVHAGHEKASVVSIPRDTLVTRPECKGRNDKLRPEATRQVFNTAYEIGGPVCAVKTVERLANIRMDHYLEVDFSGFKQIIDELGGVEITTTRDIKDPKSKLDLPKGTHRLNGEQSLGLVRTRKTVGDSSDLGRIQLQQAFVKALMEQVKDVGVFSNPKKMYNLADAATRTVTTDSGLGSVPSLLSFGNALGGIGSKDMKMITLPIDYDAKDKYRVIPLKDQSATLWQSLREDKPIPDSVTEDSAGDKVDADKVIKGD